MTCRKTNIGNAITKYAFGVLLAICASTIIAAPTNAQIADTPCDPEYYKSLESRAWLEAQREITQNQNLIFKPDSVLEYTCFDTHLRELADHADEMFSETTRWGSILSSDSMDNALTNLVTQATETYLQANFDHSLLGGRSTQNYSPDSTTSGGNYGCDIMQKVWLEAKCMDFIDNSTNDGFYTFEEYRDSPDDKRFLPSACAKVALWADEIEIANAEGDIPWAQDAVVTYYDNIFPTSSACGSGASSRIATGLYVKRGKQAPREYNEFACVVPGCYWEPTGTSTGECKTY